jgi:hypothetical protein
VAVPRAEKLDAVEILRKENELMRAAMAVAEEAAKAGTEALQVAETLNDPQPADPDLAQHESLGSASPPPAADPSAADDTLAVDQAVAPLVAVSPQACAPEHGKHRKHAKNCTDVVSWVLC